MQPLLPCLALIVGIVAAQHDLPIGGLIVAALVLQKPALAFWCGLGWLQVAAPLVVCDTSNWRIPGDWIGVREAALASLGSGLGEADRRLLGGMVLGRTAAGFTLRQYPHWVDAGMSHLLVASGAQVTLLVFPILSLIRHSDLAPRLSRLLHWIVLGQIALVLLLTGLEPSILRAATLGAWLLIAGMVGRPVDSWLGLCRVALMWLALDPALLHSASFQLSYAATAGIVLVCPRIELWLEGRAAPRWVHRVSGVIAPTVAAQCAVWPILSSWFGDANWQGFVANCLAVPLSEGVILLGATKLLVGWGGWQGLDGLWNPFLHWGLWLLDGIARVCGGWPSFTPPKLHGALAGAILLTTMIALKWSPRPPAVPSAPAAQGWRVIPGGASSL